LALFAGAGGGILGGHLLGWRTVCAVERERYAADVLVARQNDGSLPPFPIWDDVCTFDGRDWCGRVDVVSGGFPCQDISAAGKGAGIGGERSGLWGHMARVIGEVRPKFAFMENSPMLTGRGLGVVLGNLADLGFDAEWCVLGASDVGAPHLRKRIWILAHAAGERGDQGRHDVPDANSFGRQLVGLGGVLDGKRAAFGDDAHRCRCSIAYADSVEGGVESRRRCGALRAREADARREGLARDVSDADRERLEGTIVEPRDSGRARACGGGWPAWPAEPDVGRVVPHGVAARVDRLRAIGNGQVPRVAAAAFELLRARGGW
jgi:DNA (cytosine-5)-methyltransferase 1